MNLYVDDIRNCPYDEEWIKEEWETVRTYSDALDMIRTGDVIALSLDHDLGEERSGYDLLKEVTVMVWNGEIPAPERVIFHTANPVGRRNMDQLWSAFMERYNNKGR